MEIEKLFIIQKQLNKKNYKPQLEDKYLDINTLTLIVKISELSSDFINFDYNLYRKNEYTLGQLVNILEALLNVTIELEYEYHINTELQLMNNKYDNFINIETSLIRIHESISYLSDDDSIVNLWLNFIDIYLDLDFTWEEISNEYINSREYLLNL